MKEVLSMDPILIAILVMLFLTSLVILLSMHTLKEGHVLVIERLGAYYKVMDQPGIHFTIPLLERVIETVDMRIQHKKYAMVHEGHDILIRYSIQVKDPKLFVYGSLDAMKSFENQLHVTYVESVMSSKDRFEHMYGIAHALGMALVDLCEQ